MVDYISLEAFSLEGDATANKEQVNVKHESLNQSGTLKEETETKEPKVNPDVSKVLKRDFKIHGVVAGDNFKDGLSFVSFVCKFVPSNRCWSQSGLQ